MYEYSNYKSGSGAAGTPKRFWDYGIIMLYHLQ